MRTNNRVILTKKDRNVLETLDRLAAKGNKHAEVVAKFIRLGGKTMERATKIGYVVNPGIGVLGVVDYLREAGWKVAINPDNGWLVRRGFRKG